MSSRHFSHTLIDWSVEDSFWFVFLKSTRTTQWRFPAANCLIEYWQLLNSILVALIFPLPMSVLGNDHNWRDSSSINTVESSVDTTWFTLRWLNRTWISTQYRSYYCSWVPCLHLLLDKTFNLRNLFAFASKSNNSPIRDTANIRP